MKYYLSSFKLGNELEKLHKLIKNTSSNFGCVANSQDYIGADSQKKTDSIQSAVLDLQNHDVNVEMLDLKDYFGNEDELKSKLQSLDGLYVLGGNTFVLRQAMRLSGFDNLITELQKRDDFLYIAYSAGVCVLTPTLKPYAITDDANNFPYPEITEQIWEGLDIVPFVFQPHFKSDHPESASTDKEIEYCIENKLLFKAYKDGEVLIIE